MISPATQYSEMNMATRLALDAARSENVLERAARGFNSIFGLLQNYATLARQAVLQAGDGYAKEHPDDIDYARMFVFELGDGLDFAAMRAAGADGSQIGVFYAFKSVSAERLRSCLENLAKKNGVDCHSINIEACEKEFSVREIIRNDMVVEAFDRRGGMSARLSAWPAILPTDVATVRKMLENQAESLESGIRRIERIFKRTFQKIGCDFRIEPRPDKGDVFDISIYSGQRELERGRASSGDFEMNGKIERWFAGYLINVERSRVKANELLNIGLDIEGGGKLFTFHSNVESIRGDENRIARIGVNWNCATNMAEFLENFHHPNLPDIVLEAPSGIKAEIVDHVAGGDKVLADPEAFEPGGCQNILFFDTGAQTLSVMAQGSSARLCTFRAHQARELANRILEALEERAGRTLVIRSQEPEQRTQRRRMK